MSRQIKMAGILFVVVAFVSGCASSGKPTSLKARAYVTDQERVDQSMEGGNFGYLMGTPKPEDRSAYKKTRKVYVLEVSKEEELPENEPLIPPPLPKPIPQASAPAPVPAPAAAQPAYEPIVIPNFDEEVAPVASQPAAPAGSYTEYTIQKNDTLQKISKKHYNTYRKWMQIYEANKDVIPDPNVIKPGVTIRIPVE